MHTLSSASRTCMASASAVECTATVATPSSLQARSTRSAISPRFAIRIFSNIDLQPSFRLRPIPSLQFFRLACELDVSLDDQQRLSELDRLRILEQDLHHRAGARRGNLVHGLHRLDDQ